VHGLYFVFKKILGEEDLVTNKTSLPFDLKSPVQPVYIYDESKNKLLYIAKSVNNVAIVLETGSDSIRKSIQPLADPDGLYFFLKIYRLSP